MGESQTQPGWYTWSLGYGFDSNAALSAQSYPDGMTVTYSPNALGQPTSALNTAGQIYASGVRYYPNGAISQFVYGNGITHTMQQNARQLPLQVRSGNVTGYEYWYDGNGNVTHQHDLVQGSGYSRVNQYDQLDRLTGSGSASYGGDHWHRFTYDAIDNIASWKLAGIKDYAKYVYDVKNRLSGIKNSSGVQVVSLSYDVQGNLVSKNGQAHSFDYGNRLRDVTGKDLYRYDAAGRRVMTSMPGKGNILSIYSLSGQILFDENHRKPGVVATNHVYLAGSLLASRERTYSTGTSQTKYHHTDALGSPVAVTNQQAQVLERTNYEPYGSVIGRSNNDKPGYTGHVMDSETGLTYMQQRYYDPQIGRFLSTDPVQANANTGASFNRYAYTANNPYRFTDPDGRHESPAWMRATIPGQITWDHALTSFENGNYGQGAILAGAALTEGAIGVVTLGQSQRVAAPFRAAITATEAGSIRSVNAVRGATNCVSCAIATDATLAGRPASALASGPTPIAALEKTFGTQFGAKTNVQGVAKAMENAGAGARGIVFGSRGEGQVGHVFNVVNQNGTIRFLDGQTGNAAVTSGYENLRLLRTNP